MRNTAKRHILITVPIEPDWLARLQKLSPDLQIEVRPIQRDVRPRSRMGEIPDELWQNVEIFYTPSFLPTLQQAPNLRWVHLYSAGADHILKHPVMDSPVIITTSSGVHIVSIPEYVMMMQLAWFHRLPFILEQQYKAQWPVGKDWLAFSNVPELRGKTLGIVGYGSIGRGIAHLAKAFGMRIVAQQYSDDHRDHGFIFPDVGDPDGILPDCYYKLDQLHCLLQESDVVVIAVPLTPQTTNLFDAAAFSAMKPDAFLINIARGEVCNEQDLIQALQEKCIAGAALDVHDPEPLPPDHPLWQLPNVMISPHISGGTARYPERSFMIFEENLQRYLAGEPLYNAVNKERGY